MRENDLIRNQLFNDVSICFESTPLSKFQSKSPLWEHLDGGRISFCALCSKDQVDLSLRPLDPDKNRYGTRERKKGGINTRLITTRFFKVLDR